MAESELLGHEKGAFTGATANRAGVFEEAHGGTLFFDEISTVHLEVQAKLLRVIQERAVRPVGDTKEIPVDVRFLSASHKDLASLVADGEFREDLFWRLVVVRVRTSVDGLYGLGCATFTQRHEAVRAAIEKHFEKNPYTPEWADEVDDYDFDDVGALADLETYIAYNLLTILCCASLLPLALTQATQPETPRATRLRPALAWACSPLGVAAVLVSALSGVNTAGSSLTYSIFSYSADTP